MRLSLWLLALIALSTGGCVFPCTNGACSSGEPRYIPPAARFFGTEKLLPQTLLSSQCDIGRCQPSPYLTCSKYLPFLDKWTSSTMARRCANRYLLKQQFQTRRWISKHYKAGFRDAFSDVANGESGEVPALPPPKYWNTHYRTEKGKRCVELYFDGYRSGSALAAAEFTTMKTVGASYDWSIQKPKRPCAPTAGNNCGHGGACSTGQGCSLNGGCAPGMPSQMGPQSQFGMQPQMSPQPQFSPQPPPLGPQPSFGPQSQFGPPAAGSQNGPMPPESASVFPMSPQSPTQPPASGIGPTNPYPVPDSGFGQLPQQQRQPQQTLGLPAPSNNGFNSGQLGSGPLNSGQSLNLPAPASPPLPNPGYANPGGSIGPQTSSQNQSGPLNQNQNGALTPGYSQPPGGQVSPGKLGPPDEFKHEPPAWRYPAPQR